LAHRDAPVKPLPPHWKYSLRSPVLAPSVGLGRTEVANVLGTIDGGGLAL
jgi:hypothetical protein